MFIKRKLKRKHEINHNSSSSAAHLMYASTKSRMREVKRRRSKKHSTVEENKYFHFQFVYFDRGD